jgi:hypothetical protein
MVVKIDKTIFQEATNPDSFLELQYLLYVIFYKGRYKLIIVDDIQSEPTFLKLSKNDQDVLNESFIQGLSGDGHFDCDINSILRRRRYKISYTTNFNNSRE